MPKKSSRIYIETRKIVNTPPTADPEERDQRQARQREPTTQLTKPIISRFPGPYISTMNRRTNQDGKGQQKHGPRAEDPRDQGSDEKCPVDYAGVNFVTCCQ